MLFKLFKSSTGFICSSIKLRKLLKTIISLISLVFVTCSYKSVIFGGLRSVGNDIRLTKNVNFRKQLYIVVLVK